MILSTGRTHTSSEITIASQESFLDDRSTNLTVTETCTDKLFRTINIGNQRFGAPHSITRECTMRSHHGPSRMSLALGGMPFQFTWFCEENPIQPGESLAASFHFQSRASPSQPNDGPSGGYSSTLIQYSAPRKTVNQGRKALSCVAFGRTKNTTSDIHQDFDAHMQKNNGYEFRLSSPKGDNVIHDTPPTNHES